MGASRQLVVVNWLDTVTKHTWRDIEAAEGLKPSEIMTIGVLVKETPEHVIVAHTWADDDDVNEVTCVPRGAIIEVLRLHNLRFAPKEEVEAERKQAAEKPRPGDWLSGHPSAFEIEQMEEK